MAAIFGADVERRGDKYVCTLGLGHFGPRCGALYHSLDRLRAHQHNIAHNSYNKPAEWREWVPGN